MSCPQGLTLSGKMCTIAPILSCPSGYTLVNGMCQEDDGLQGFGDSMNLPPTDNSQLQFQSGEIKQDIPVTPQPVTPPVQPVRDQLQPLTDKLIDSIPRLPGQDMIPKMPSSPLQRMEMPSSPLQIRRPAAMMISPQPVPMKPLTAPSRPTSPSQIRRMSGSPPPPPQMRSPTPMRPVNETCPVGYSMNRADGMCYPL